MSVRVNRGAFERAEGLIKGRQYEKDSDWSEAQPSTEEENRVIEERGWDEYANWHLAYDDSEGENTKKRYRFPFGDFERLHRSALVAAEQRAGGQHYSEVERAARELLESMPEG